MLQPIVFCSKLDVLGPLHDILLQDFYSCILRLLAVFSTFIIIEILLMITFTTMHVITIKNVLIIISLNMFDKILNALYRPTNYVFLNKCI